VFPTQVVVGKHKFALRFVRQLAGPISVVEYLLGLMSSSNLTSEGAENETEALLQAIGYFYFQPGVG